MSLNSTIDSATHEAVAIIGMAGRFPAADSVAALWQNLLHGVDAISDLAEEDLLAAGVDRALLDNPDYVRAAGQLATVDEFDADLFGYTPSEAAILDPQQRLLLEGAYQALDDAGYGGSCDRDGARTGVFAGTGTSHYAAMLHNAVLPGLDFQALMHACEKDFAATRIAFKLDLRGPALSVQTACSTSLVAVCIACDHLLAGHCDLALAGGASLRLPQTRGYLYQTGGVLSRDGRCRAFDADATGTSVGSGVALVVLKRLEDALADGDSIRAVIRGYGLNNDGKDKAGFSAPSAEGQAEAIETALEMAGLDASDVGFVEAHGTGTPLGDAIELTALNEVFGSAADGSCLLGSLKSNLGHLDAAAGVAGLIKAAQVVRHGLVPPTLHFQSPHRFLGLDRTAFRVNREVERWPADRPRRAGVSSFGIGGTNAHVVVEQFVPPQEEAVPDEAPPRPSVLLFSGRSEAAAEGYARQVAEALPEVPSLADAAFTLQVGRRHFSRRLAYVCSDVSELSLASAAASGVVSERRSASFLFSGFGVDCRPSAIAFYGGEPVFRAMADDCARAAAGIGLGGAVEQLWARQTADPDPLLEPHPGMVAMFTYQVALAATLEAAGVEPAAMLGYSLGEYAAAYRAGVFSLEDALRLVHKRAELFAKLPPGAMLAVAASAEETEPLMDEALSLAAINAPQACVVSGTTEAVGRADERLRRRGIQTRFLATAVPAHSHLLAPVLEEFGEAVSKATLLAPRLPLVTSLTGTWMTPEQATEPSFWVDQLRHTVQFAAAIRTLLQQPAPVLLEVGPTRALASLARLSCGEDDDAVVLSCGRHRHGTETPETLLQTALAGLWACGVEVDWAQRQKGNRRRVPLPASPLERQRYWVEVSPRASEPAVLDVGSRDAEAVEADEELALPRHGPAVRRAFRTILGFEQIGLDESFFDLGGDSLMALRLTAVLSQDLGRSVSPEVLVQHPTVRKLAASLESAAPVGNGRYLVPLRPGEAARTLYCIHPAGGNVLCYRDLAQHLGGAGGLVGVKARGLDNGQKPLASVSEMADLYLQAMAESPDQGALYLIGLSFGGAVAFEMARRLEGDGREVAFVALLDTPSPGQLSEDLESRSEILAYLAGPASGLRASQLYGLEPAEQLARALRFGRLRELFPDPAHHDDARRYVEVFERNLVALRTYDPGRYDGRVHFYKAAVRSGHQPEAPEALWQELAGGGLELRVVPGAHETMIDPPHVAGFAQELEKEMRNHGWQ
ncbi:MAG: beta-ketoacyl synthase N-terminal-like domain-containing protein [Acidobacteriota bacterium]